MVALVVIAAACDSDGATATPSITPTPMVSVVVLSHETPTASPSATPAAEVQHTVWLLNLWGTSATRSTNTPIPRPVMLASSETVSPP